MCQFHNASEICIQTTDSPQIDAKTFQMIFQMRMIWMRAYAPILCASGRRRRRERKNCVRRLTVQDV